MYEDCEKAVLWLCSCKANQPAKLMEVAHFDFEVDYFRMV